ncbi:MAG: hypothetical protein OXC18_23365 [Desulfurellaceae bacterium]|nr:hypothetical protein [Desulfurellaceae bacterium]
MAEKRTAKPTSMDATEFIEKVSVIEGSNIRLDLGEIEEFAKEIQGQGQLYENIRIREATAEDKAAGVTTPYALNADGHRRHAALAYLVENDLVEDFAEVPVTVVCAGTRTDVLVEMLATGSEVDKKALTAVEEANGFTQLRDEGHSVEEIAKLVGRTGQFVRDRMRLWKASEELKDASKDLSKGGIGTSMAVQIARAHPDDPEKQKELVARAQQGPEARSEISRELDMDGGKKRREREEEVRETQLKEYLSSLRNLIVDAQKKRNCPQEIKDIRLDSEDPLDKVADGSTLNRIIFAYGKARGALEALGGEDADKTNIWDYS